MALRLVTVDDLAALLSAGRAHAVLDVRDLRESEHGHVPGAAILPRRRLEFRIGALVRDRATPLVVVDSGDEIAPGQRDPRAALAADTLAALGYRDVAVLDGGMAAWRSAGRPTLPGIDVSSQALGRRIADVEQVPTIDAGTLRQWQRDRRRVALCDVRGAAEHTGGCVPGAVSLPGFEAVTHALDMAAESDVIVLCSGASTRSLVIARTLIDLGLGDVAALDGGTLAWSLAGHELERGSRRRRVAPSVPARRFAELGAARLAKHFGVGSLEAAELAALMAEARGNFSAFDLRDAGLAHVPHSVPVASDVLVVRHEELVAVRDAPVVLVDDDAVRALLTGVWLRRLGSAQVRTLAGGFAAWTQAGHPTSAFDDETPLGWREAGALAPGLGVDDVSGWLATYAPVHVLHVDTGASFRRGHLPGATWLPRGWLEARIAAVAPSLGQALLLTCDDGAQAAFAAATLRRRGYVHVAWLRGGTRRWSAAGRSLETAPPPQDDGLPPPARRGPQAVRDDLDRERLR